MDEQQINLGNRTKNRTPFQKGALFGIIAFIIVGYVLAASCLCQAGAVRGKYKSIFYLIVLVRLFYGLLKRNLRLDDYLLWTVAFLLFCIVAEYL